MSDMIMYKSLSFPSAPTPGRTDLSFAERLAEGIWQRRLPSHLSSCHRCQMRWDTVNGHSTPYSETESLFPLCVECWEDLQPAERLPYYRALWLEWKRSGCNDADWSNIATNVLNGL